MLDILLLFNWILSLIAVHLDLSLIPAHLDHLPLSLTAGGPTAVVLMVASAILEGPALAAGTAQLLASHPVPFLAAFTMSFLVNLSCFFAIKYTRWVQKKREGGASDLSRWMGVRGGWGEADATRPAS
jgi:hypothetical protein